MENKRLPHINAVKPVVDFLFSETIEKKLSTEEDEILIGTERIKGIEYVRRKANTRDKHVLKKIANEKLERYISEHPDNTKELFIETELDKANQYQKSFSEYKTNKEHKEYFFKLQRWIDYLSEMSDNSNDRIYLKPAGSIEGSIHNFLEETGLGVELSLNPTHNFELLKKHRLSLYVNAQEKFKKERHLDAIETTSEDLNTFKSAWYRHELKVIETWLSDSYPNGEKKKIKSSVSHQMEILKYQKLVTSKIEKADALINGVCHVPYIGDLFKKNLNIPANIRDAYYNQVQQPKSEGEISVNYRGKLNHYNNPFKYSIYGAYPLSDNWDMIKYKMQHANDNEYHKAYQTEDVNEALVDYAKGFQYGYDNFMNNIVSPPNALSNTEATKVEKIIVHLSNIFPPNFSECSGIGTNVFDNWYEDGKEAGYYYRAWYLILENPTLFKPYFDSKAIGKNNDSDTQNQKQVASKPIFQPIFIDKISELIDIFFHENDRAKFKELLKTGNDINEPLLFLSNGNRLADAFKQLKKADIITGCEQKELEDWILKNFRYKQGEQERSYTARYLNDIISSNKDKCQKPILNVKKDKTSGNYVINKP